MKITLATVKKFIRNNRDNLVINLKSDFDGMTDCVQNRDGGFCKAEKENREDRPFYTNDDRTLGIKKAWFVGGSRDYFTAYEDAIYRGINISNCCGRFILAIKK